MNDSEKESARCVKKPMSNVLWKNQLENVYLVKSWSILYPLNECLSLYRCAAVIKHFSFWHTWNHHHFTPNRRNQQTVETYNLLCNQIEWFALAGLRISNRHVDQKIFAAEIKIYLWSCMQNANFLFLAIQFCEFTLFILEIAAPW